jgi:hypothetical protein
LSRAAFDCRARRRSTFGTPRRRAARQQSCAPSVIACFASGTTTSSRIWTEFSKCFCSNSKNSPSPRPSPRKRGEGDNRCKSRVRAVFPGLGL